MAGPATHLLLHGVRVEPEDGGRRLGIGHADHGRVGDQQHIRAVRHLDGDFGVHVGPQQAFVVVQQYQDGEHGHVLVHRGLRFDLLDAAHERPARVRLHRNLGGQARLHLADVRLVDQRPHAHRRQVGHLHERGAARHVLARGRDDLPRLDILRKDGPGDGGGDLHVAHAFLGELEIRLCLDQRGPCVRGLQHGLLVVRLGHHVGVTKLLRSLLLCRRHLHLRLRDLQVCLRLGKSVAHIARIDFGHQRALLDVIADVHVQGQDLARGLRLDLHDLERLQKTGRFHLDVQIAALNRRRLIRRVGLRRGALPAAGRHASHQDEYAQCQERSLHRVPPLVGHCSLPTSAS
ncbi:MAG: hypothetical protein P8174_07905, partial [Gemmatimonadota bacterium]